MRTAKKLSMGSFIEHYCTYCTYTHTHIRSIHRIVVIICSWCEINGIEIAKTFSISRKYWGRGFCSFFGPGEMASTKCLRLNIFQGMERGRKRFFSTTWRQRRAHFWSLFTEHSQSSIHCLLIQMDNKVIIKFCYFNNAIFPGVVHSLSFEMEMAKKWFILMSTENFNAHPSTMYPSSNICKYKF